MITPTGLEDQLLGILAAREKPELEEKKNELIIESAANKKQVGQDLQCTCILCIKYCTVHDVHVLYCTVHVLYIKCSLCSL